MNFRASLQTVEDLYKSQRPKLRHKLRLDVASHTCPVDWTAKYDPATSPDAVGERLVRCLHGYADEVQLNQPETSEVLVQPTQNHFVDGVHGELTKQFGLDRENPLTAKAMAELAEEFWQWVQKDAEAMQRYHFAAKHAKVYVCAIEAYCDKEFSKLPPAEASFSAADLRDFLKKRQ